MEDFISFLAFIFGMIIAAFAAVFLIVVFMYYGGSKPACEQYARLTGAEISTEFWGASCLVKQDGRWVDYDVAVKNKQEIKISK